MVITTLTFLCGKNGKCYLYLSIFSINISIYKTKENVLVLIKNSKCLDMDAFSKIAVEIHVDVKATYCSFCFCDGITLERGKSEFKHDIIT